MKIMRPLVHPAIEDVRLDGILHALSDPVRAKIFMRVVNGPCAQSCAAFAQIDDRNIPKSSLSQPFKVLREAGLIRSERIGVEMRNTARCEEIERRFPGLVQALLEAQAAQVAHDGRAAGT